MARASRQGGKAAELMYYVYILKSLKSSCYYVGQTQDLQKRLENHNNNGVTSTRSKGPWIICYSEVFDTRHEAILREHKIKSYKSGEAFKKLISGNSSDG